MNWTDEEAEEGCKAFANVNPDGDTDLSRREVRAIMTRAMELLATRGGIDPIVLQARLSALMDMTKSTAARLEERHAVEALFISLGATVATLQAKVEEMERGIANREFDLHRLWEWVRSGTVPNGGYKTDAGLHLEQTIHAEVERLNREVEKEAEDSLKVIGEYAERIRTAEARLAAIRERGIRAELAAERARSAAGVPYSAFTNSWAEQSNASRRQWEQICVAVASWVLEGDAPQGAQDLVETVTVSMGMAGAIPTVTHHVRYPCSLTCTHDDAATPGHPERVKERSEAVVRIGMHSAEMVDAWDKGAEATRAACWAAVQPVLQRHGWTSKDGTWTEIKAAIEGAAP